MQNAKIKNKIQNSKLILLQRKSLPILIFLLLFFLGFIYCFTKRRPAIKKGFINPKKKFADLVTQSTPTPVIITTPAPTPTLTPQEIAEIERQKFIQLNQKYGPCKSVPILMYHHVLDAGTAKSIGATNLNVTPETFRSQMDYLIGKGYQIIRLDEMASMLISGSLPGKPVVLTFDDGYRDFYDYVFPILKEKNIKATVFVISQFTGGERYLVWAQVKELANSGLVLIGDHTLNHSSLPKLNREEEANQIVSAKNVIESNISQAVRFFAYPYGSNNQAAKEILKENGFLGAVTTIPGRTQCAGLPYDWQRIRIGGGVLSKYGL